MTALRASRDGTAATTSSKRTTPTRQSLTSGRAARHALQVWALSNTSPSASTISHPTRIAGRDGSGDGSTISNADETHDVSQSVHASRHDTRAITPMQRSSTTATSDSKYTGHAVSERALEHAQTGATDSIQRSSRREYQGTSDSFSDSSTSSA